MSKERVAIVKVTEQCIDEALQHMLDLLGGLDVIVPRGSRVLIKPNFVFPPTDSGVTHPELVEAVVRMIADTEPKEILIGEGSADVYTSQGFRFQNMGYIAARYGAKLVDLNLEEGIKTPVPSGLGRDYIMLPKPVIESDILISLPVFKLWGGFPVSLSLKNLIGLYGARYYGHNKDSQQRADDPGYALPGEIGSELGAHQPNVPMSICAMNSVVKTHLAIIDALEGGDGSGNWIRLDTLIGGRNPVATDTVACQMTGIIASEHETFSLCAEYGLGPCDIQQIEVVGEELADVSFHLERLRDNVLEMPVRFCLNLLSTGELLQIQRALNLYNLAEAGAPMLEDRETLLTMLTEVVSSEGYYEHALEQCTDYALGLLDIIIEAGGTSGSMMAVSKVFGKRLRSLYYYPSHRMLTRLGLAYAVDSAASPYYLLPEGITAALERLKASASGSDDRKRK